nr:MAG TPA: lytic transglycosylase [Caudoviricetes sp.]
MAVGSIVDYLKSIGQDSSYSSRKNLASQYGISNYSGTASQNTNLLKALQSGSSQAGSTNNNTANGANVTITPVSSSSSGSPATNYLTGYQYQKYTPSSKVTDYADKLADLEDSKPDAYVSKYDSTIDDLIDSILNREQFDPNSVYDTDLYKNYREQYMQQGNKAMRDTIGNISGMTGGYGSTYATAAGQQAYDNYLSQLGDKTLDIYDRVYQQYLNEGQELYNQLGMVNNQDSIDYGRYRDTVSDYYNDLNYYAGRYDSSYNQDFGEYQYDQDAMRWAEEYAYQKTQDALAQQNWQTQFDYQKEQDALQYALQQQQLALSASRSSSGGSSKSSKTSTNAYLTKAINMLSGTDGSDTHKYQSRTVSNYLKNQYGLSTEEAEYITSQANAEIQKTTNANTDKYYEYAATYAKEHDADEVFDYLNRYYENNKISAEEADEIYRRLGLD